MVSEQLQLTVLFKFTVYGTKYQVFYPVLFYERKCCMKIQIGVPMTEETLNSMSEKERKFWHSFHHEVEKFIELCNLDGKEEPYNPPESLQKKYEMAILDYDGGKYCQVRWLESVISFNSIQIHSAN